MRLKIARLIVSIFLYSFTAASGQDTIIDKNLYDLVLRQKPGKLSDIDFREGEIFSISWIPLKFVLYHNFNDTSHVVLRKDAGSAAIIINDKEICNFFDTIQKQIVLVFSKIRSIGSTGLLFFEIYGCSERQHKLNHVV
jgi:hypothetical protein